MYLSGSVWSSITYVVNILTLSPAPWGYDEQVPLPINKQLHQDAATGPTFAPPGGSLTGSGSTFTCEYPSMVGWESCSTADDRTCWLKNNETGAVYDINTNYEDPTTAPIGVQRTYQLDLGDTWFNADGMNFTEAKLFNDTYPGPWIQACWGDTISVVVKNNLKHNGTSIHWHGIRQYLSLPMDGVNGITQCPIAPGDSFNYTWTALQYGSSWYHSHYSVQYGDGVVGPLTLHGPTSAPYDEAVAPILMTEWGHNSAFDAIINTVKNPSVLLNGRGNVTAYTNSVVAPLEIPTPYTINFTTLNEQQTRPKRYLLRLINTSLQSTLIFSIDNHLLQIVSADFVPIHPYMNTSVLVGIGQRYNVIVEADPQASGGDLPADGNYWIRTWRAEGCFKFPPGSEGYERTGIIRYDSNSTAFPNTTAWANISLKCSDETYTSLRPIVPWTVGPAANVPSGEIGENLNITFQFAETNFQHARLSMGGKTFNPLHIDFGNPTFLNLDNTGKWNPLWVVFPENYTSDEWVYLALIGPQNALLDGAHPMHLHGHDFAVLQQIENVTFPDGLNLTLNNPPRRDVVNLPQYGYVVIAFKTDNPGVWTMHCHVVNHAAYGMALQVLERQDDALALWPATGDAGQMITQGCQKWNDWAGDCRNWWHAPNTTDSCAGGENQFAPDSGI